MSSEAVRNLSISDLLRALNEKLGLEYARVLEIRLPLFVSASLETDIERLEARAHDVLRLVRSFRNLLQPVNRLPTEILSRIVRYVPFEFDTDAWQIIPLTHVCRYWRESIISTPSNWSLISSEDEDLMALSLKRSKATPLELRLCMNQVREKPGLSDLLMAYTRNTKTLHIGSILTAEDLTQNLPNFLQSMPNLRSLELWADAIGERDRSMDPFEPLAPTLTSLSLDCIHLYPSFLRLKALTELTLRDEQFSLRLDALLDFLEENRSLERAELEIGFMEPSLRNSQRRSPIANQLQHLSITYDDPRDGKALSSSIALRRGAHLEIVCHRSDTGLNDILSGVSTMHLSNLRSPTFMEYQSYFGGIQLRGPNGRFSFSRYLGAGNPFEELSLIPLTSIREFHLVYHTPKRVQSPPDPIIFGPSSFPALEVLAVECDTDVSRLLSPLLSDPSSSPSLRTLAFLDCVITEAFVEELTRFASERMNSASAWLHRVVIVHTEGEFPNIASIRVLGEHVPVVDTRMGSELPKDLM